MIKDIYETSSLEVCTPADLVKENPSILTEPQLRWIVKTRHKNGLAEVGAVLIVSRKIYINIPLFWEWFLKQKA